MSRDTRFDLEVPAGQRVARETRRKSLGDARGACQSRGRAAALWLLTLLGITLLIGWLASRTGPEAPEAVPGPGSIAADGGSVGSKQLAVPLEGSRLDPAVQARRGEMEKAFVGRGVIRGQVQVAEGLEFPDRWQLVVEPARYLEGRDKAVRRTLDITDGSREFEVTDLPLGGYEVSARAPGMNGVRQSVLLFTVEGRPDLPGNRYTYLNLWLTPSGFVDGSVVDEHGTPVAELPVTLRSPGSHESLEVTTDPAGNYIFPVVLDGEYEILFGDPDRPLRPAEWFTFQAPSMRYPEREIPASVDVTFHVFDEHGQPLDQASVRGYGDTGSTVDLVTDTGGVARARFLPPGKYRVEARNRAGLRGKMNFEAFPSDGSRRIEIVAKP